MHDFPVQLSRSVRETVRVTWRTKVPVNDDGTVPSGWATDDITDRRATLIFRNGETTKNIWVGVYQDPNKEDDEIFQIQLSLDDERNPPALTCGRCTATITILDDD